MAIMQFEPGRIAFSIPSKATSLSFKQSDTDKVHIGNKHYENARRGHPVVSVFGILVTSQHWTPTVIALTLSLHLGYN